METRSRRAKKEAQPKQNGMNGHARDAADGDPKTGSWGEWWTRWEMPRKILHTSIGFFALYGWVNNTDVPTLVFWLMTALAIIVTADVLRFNIKPFAWLYELLLGFLMRPSEKYGWNGVIFYLVGVSTVLTLLPRDLAVFSVMTLSWCDTAASTLGQIYGRYTPRLPSPPFAARKSVAGFSGAFVVGAAAGYVFWTRLAPINGSASDISWDGARTTFIASPFNRPDTVGQAVSRWAGSDVGLLRQWAPPRSTLSAGALSLACGLIGAVAESLDVFGLDDNVVLPIISGLSLYAVMALLR